MEQKLEKKCKVHDLKLGKRYCLTSLPEFKFILKVIEVHTHYVRFQYFDGTVGMAKIRPDSDFSCYEMPYTPLEQELL